jgi:cytochrome c biogenesis protein CcdA
VNRREAPVDAVVRIAVFILPLVVILIAASSHPTLVRLARWNLQHKEWVRLALGSGVVVMGLLILATV